MMQDNIQNAGGKLGVDSLGDVKETRQSSARIKIGDYSYDQADRYQNQDINFSGHGQEFNAK